MTQTLLEKQNDTELALSLLTTQTPARVYSGKPGCMCGCNGRYSTSKMMTTRIVNLLLSADVQLTTWQAHEDGVNAAVHAEVDGRNTVAYFRVQQ